MSKLGKKNSLSQQSKVVVSSTKAGKVNSSSGRLSNTNQPSSELGSRPVLLTIDAAHDGQRLDNFLITLLKGVPKSHIYRIIRKGEVRINKGRVKQTTRLVAEDVVRIPPIKLTERVAQQVDGEKYSFLRNAMLYEDESLLVLNKPSGMAVHAGSGVRVGIIEALRALRSDLKYLELAHRLDRETSGCLVLAKRAAVLRALNEDFKTNSLKNKRLDKRYLTLVKGRWKHGERKIDKALDTESRRAGERHVTVSAQGSYASSIFTPEASNSTASLVAVKLLTGRTHQVRVHAAAEGHPVAGDQRYGDHEFNKLMRSQQGLRRLFLHAAQITFNHPVSNARISVRAPLPDDLQKVLRGLNLSVTDTD